MFNTIYRRKESVSHKYKCFFNSRIIFLWERWVWWAPRRSQISGCRFVSVNHKSPCSIFKKCFSVCFENNANGETQIPPYLNLENNQNELNTCTKLKIFCYSFQYLTTALHNPVIFVCLFKLIYKCKIVNSPFVDRNAFIYTAKILYNLRDLYRPLWVALF